MTITTKRMFATLCAVGMLGVGTALAIPGTSSLPYATNFELTGGTPITNLAAWISTSDDLSTISNITYSAPACGLPMPDPHTKVLSLNTQGAVLTNNFGSINLQLPNTQPVFMDTMVQFVPSDSTPTYNGTALDSPNALGLKLAVFANSSSNLVIYHGWLNGAGNGTWASNGISVCSQVIDTSLWYRLTITFSADYNNSGETYIPWLQVKLNGAVVTNSDAYSQAAKDGIYSSIPTDTSANGTWFLSADRLDQSLTASTFQGLGFMGTGNIDDLVVKQSDPFGLTSYTLIQIIGLNGTADNTNTPISVTANTSTTITYSATTYGYLIDTLTTNGVTVTAAADLATYPVSMIAASGILSNNVSFHRPNRTIALTPSGNFTGATSIPNGAYATNLFTVTTYYKVATAGGYDSILSGGIGQDTIQLVAGPITNNSRSETVTETRPTRHIVQTIGANGNGSLGTGDILVPNGANTSVTYTASDWYTATATAGTYGAPSGNGTKNATATFTEVLADTTAGATFSQKSVGAVVALVPSSYAVLTGKSEVWAVAHSNAMQQGYMLNLDPDGINPAIAITAVSVSGTDLSVTVLLKNNDSPTNTTINGTLWVYSTDDLEAGFTGAYKYTFQGDSFSNGGQKIVTFSDADPNKFYKAEITLP